MGIHYKKKHRNHESHFYFVEYKLSTANRFILLHIFLFPNASIKIGKKDTSQSLAKKILKQEHKLYPKALLKVFSL